MVELYKHCQRHNGPEDWVHTTTSDTNLDQISISESRLSIDTKISRKHQYLDKSWSNLALAKIQLRNLNQTSAAKYWPNFSFKILPELQLQNLDQTLCSKSDQKLSFMTKPQLPNLQQTVDNTILSINISNGNNLYKFWVGIFTRQGHINQVY